MGYCSDAVILFGPVIPISVILEIYQKSEFKKTSTHSAHLNFAKWSYELEEELLGFLDSVVDDSKDTKDKMQATIVKNSEDYDQADVALDQVAIVLNLGNTLQTEFWGHSAVASKWAAAKLSDFKASKIEKDTIKKILKKLSLQVKDYPIQVVLKHTGG
jgi:hypothetical protein